MELIPNKCLGKFFFGMTIKEAITYIYQNETDIPRVKITFNENDPYKDPIFLNLQDNGFILEFEPYQQTLKKIIVYNISQIKIYYNNTLIARNSHPSFSQIYKIFGPTTPGRYDAKKFMYSLYYPSLIFNFPIPQQFNDLFVEKYSSKKRDIEIPVNLPDNTSPVLDHFIIFEGEKLNTKYFRVESKDRVEVDVRREIVRMKGGVLKIGVSSLQDVISILGPPNEIIQKGENKMRIHHQLSSSESLNCCMYNYFDLGIDILFDFENYHIISIILHTNLPSHSDFSVYSKCDFVVIFDPEDTHQNDNPSHQSNSSHQDKSSSLDIFEKDTVPSINHEQDDSNDISNDHIDVSFSIKKHIEIDSHSNWKEIEREIGYLGQPIIHDNPESLFGSSYFHGYSNFYFEIMKNGFINSFSIFSI